MGPRSAILACLALAAGAAQAADFRVTVLAVEDDPRLERTRVERAYLGHPAGPASEGVKLALDESRFQLQAAGHQIEMVVQAVSSPETARNEAAKAGKEGAVMVIADLPAAWTLAAADGVKLPVVNVGEASDRLREAECRANLFHTLPSERMRVDALAQTLSERRWRSVLLLAGPSAEDAERTAVVEAAIKRYGLKLVAKKPFKLSADPRERDLANTLLLTSGGGYDAVWVVDSDGEFARMLPYRTVLPRPVVGDAGLVALAWHAQFERFGAPQVSRRFYRDNARPMTDRDWAAWMAGKSAVAAVLAPGQNGPAAALKDLEVDGSKGVALTFRPWDGQLRQPMLMTDGQGVVATAPSEGVLHPRNVLDTLGADAPEQRCKNPR